MKFIAKLKTKSSDPECITMIGKSPKDSYVDIDGFNETPIYNLYERYNPLYFIHDMLDENWTWMDGLPQHDNIWWSHTNFTAVDFMYSYGDTIKLTTVTDCYFLLSSNGDKLIIRLDFNKSENSDESENGDSYKYTLLIGYSGSKKQLQENMNKLGIKSSLVDKVYLNEFSSRKNPWIQDDYYAD